MKNLTLLLLLATLCGCCFAVIVYPDYSTHPCKRTCVAGFVKTCYYNFAVEELFTMQPDCGNCLTGNTTACSNYQCIVADGFQRILMTVNRRLPGPQIEVCQGDTIIVNVTNLFVESVITMHWHGFDQLNNNINDGVPYVTQCPILPGTSYCYKFIASEVGTRWYHSHVGFERVTGVYGHVVVRVPVSLNPLINLYDFDLSEHTFSATEWSRRTPLDYNTAIQRLGVFNQTLTTILVNGRGVAGRLDVDTKFTVQLGSRYRFRMINSGATVCPMRVKIDRHRVSIISLDGNDIQPIDVDTFYINVGERVDFVLNANQTVQLYVMRIEGLLDCAGTNGTSVVAYEGGSQYALPTIGDGVQFNCINTPEGTTNCINYNQVRSLQSLELNLMGTADYKYYFGLNTYNYNLPQFDGAPGPAARTAAVLNDISFVFPSSPLVQTESAANLCNWEDWCGQNETMCQCTHMITIPINNLVEFIFVDEGNAYVLSHPMHLHGFSFRMIGQQYMGTNVTVQQIRQMDLNNQLVRNANYPVMKDTIGIPAAGYTIIRFRASNPGYWFLHCHVEHHAEEGMDVVLKVGVPLPTPPNFPMCGNYCPY